MGNGRSGLKKRTREGIKGGKRTNGRVMKRNVGRLRVGIEI